MTNIEAHIEKEYLELLLKGDEKAFVALYDLYANRMYSNILKMVKSPDVAQELLQDLFLKIWEKRETINPALSFRSYLFQISRNLVYNYYKRESIGNQIKEYLCSNSTELHTEEEDKLIYRQTREILDIAIDSLPPQRKLIYKLCKLDGKSYEEVGKQLNISTSTISDHIVKATKVIRQHYTLSETTYAVLFTIYILN